MNGTNAKTGKPLTGFAHLKQSINDVLSTPLGTRVIRRDYGSKLFDLIDKPLSSATRLDIIAATAEALSKWEPRYTLEKVDVSVANQRLMLTLYGQYQQSLAMIEVAI